jgi:hypothetical protein
MKNLAKALLAIQRELDPVVKSNYNTHFKSRYAGLPETMAAAIPVLNKHGVVLMQNPGYDGDTITVTTVLIHADSGESLQSTCGTKAKPDAQGTGSAITYLRRYSLQSILGLPVEDDDGEAAVGRSKAQQSQVQQSQRNVPIARPAAETVPTAPVPAAKSPAVQIQEKTGMPIATVSAWLVEQGKPPVSDITAANLKGALAYISNNFNSLSAFATKRA